MYKYFQSIQSTHQFQNFTSPTTPSASVHHFKMISFVVFAGLLAFASAAPQLYTAAIAPGLTTTQFHAQDTLGQYSYGYAGGPSAKTETRTADGITRGSYSYVDAYGILQSANYVSDPVNGFRVARTDLPVGPAAVAAAPLIAAPAPLQYAAAAPVAYAGPAAIAAHGILPIPVGDTPEVAAAKAEHFRAHAEAAARAAF